MKDGKWGQEKTLRREKSGESEQSVEMRPTWQMLGTAEKVLCLGAEKQHQGVMGVYFGQAGQHRTTEGLESQAALECQAAGSQYRL